MGWASKHRKEMKLKLSCVLDSSPICLTKVRIKMLMIIYYKCTVVWQLGLPRLRNLVNVYTSSNNRNYSVYRELPDLIFFHYADR